MTRDDGSDWLETFDSLRQLVVDLAERVERLEATGVVDRDLLIELHAEHVGHAQEVANLEAALATSRRIGAAVGILMARFNIDEEAAFRMLRKASNDRNIKVRDVADEVVETGTATGLPIPPRADVPSEAHRRDR